MDHLSKLCAFLLACMFAVSLTACSDQNTLSPSPLDTADETSLSSETVSEETDDSIPDDVIELFAEYGWSITGYLGTTEAVLPESLVTNIEDSPMQFYWMRAAILSSDIGFDLLDQLGETVTIEVYNIAFQGPGTFNDPGDSNYYDPQGIVFRGADGNILGAQNDTARHSGNAYSLAVRSFEEISGLSLLDYWYEHYFDASDPVNIAAESRTTEDVITRYFEGMASEDAAMQLSSMPLNSKLFSLFVNVDWSLPYNSSYDMLGFLDDVEVLSIEEYSPEDEYGRTMYAVLIDATLNESGKAVFDQDGEMGFYVTVIKENGRLCVAGTGTGP